MDVDAHIYTSASESGYEPINHDTPTGGPETDDDDMLDNMAYGEVGSQPVGSGQQAQYDTVIELNGNASYSSVPSTPLPGEGEYSHTMTKPAPLSSQDMTCDSIYS